MDILLMFLTTVIVVNIRIIVVEICNLIMYILHKKRINRPTSKRAVNSKHKEDTIWIVDVLRLYLVYPLKLHLSSFFIRYLCLYSAAF